MTSTIEYRFRLRRRTAASWASLNEVLLDSEIGRESDSSPPKIKIGDGVTPWNDLPYFVGDPGSLAITDIDGLQAALDEKADEQSGTWTPAFTSDGTPPSLTYTRQTGEWRRFGKMMHLFGEIEVATLSAAGTGLLQISGFPTAPSNGRYVGALTVGTCLGFVTRRPLGGYVFDGGSVCWLIGDNGAGATSELTTANLASGSLLVFHLIYALP